MTRKPPVDKCEHMVSLKEHCRQCVALAQEQANAKPQWITIDDMNRAEIAAYDMGSQEMIEALTRVLNGRDRGDGTSREPWESLRRKVLQLMHRNRDWEDAWQAVPLRFRGNISDGNLVLAVAQMRHALKGEIQP